MIRKKGIILCSLLSLSGVTAQAEMKLEKNNNLRLGGASASSSVATSASNESKTGGVVSDGNTTGTMSMGSTDPEVPGGDNTHTPGSGANATQENQDGGDAGTYKVEPAAGGDATGSGTGGSGSSSVITGGSGGSSTSGNGGDGGLITIDGGSAGTGGNGNGSGGSVELHGGNGDGSEVMRSVYRNGSSTSGSGGNITHTGGNAADSGSAGCVELTGGNSVDGDAGHIVLEAGQANGSGTDGYISLKTGDLEFGGAGMNDPAALSEGDIGIAASGNIGIKAADTARVEANSGVRIATSDMNGSTGDILISSGISDTSTAGDVTIFTSQGNGGLADGKLNLRTGNSSNIGTNAGDIGIVATGSVLLETFDASDNNTPGDIEIVGGQGGASTIDTVDGKVGSMVTIVAGTGGDAPTGGVGGEGGIGGAISIAGGTGGLGGNGRPGVGGNVTVAGGVGGMHASSGDGENGGNVTIIGGKGANGTDAGVSDGVGGHVLISSGSSGTGGIPMSRASGKVEIITHDQTTSADNNEIGISAQGALYLKAGGGIQCESAVNMSALNSVADELAIQTSDFAEDNSSSMEDGIKLTLDAGTNTLGSTADIKGGGIGIYGGSVTNTTDQTFGGTVEIEAGYGRVGGSVNIFGGEGLVTCGNVNIIGGQASMAAGGDVVLQGGDARGDVVLIGGTTDTSLATAGNVVLQGGINANAEGGNGSVIVVDDVDTPTETYALLSLLRNISKYIEGLLESSTHNVTDTSGTGTYAATLTGFSNGVSETASFKTSANTSNLRLEYNNATGEITIIGTGLSNITGKLKFGSTAEADIDTAMNNDHLVLTWNLDGSIDVEVTTN